MVEGTPPTHPRLHHIFIDLFIFIIIISISVSRPAVDKTKLGLLAANISSKSREELSTWNFDVFRCTDLELNAVLLYLFSSMNLLETFSVPQRYY